MSSKNKIKVLFVCMGNICRSPLAEGVLRLILNEENLADQFEIDSAGTCNYHVGDLPDKRAIEVAAEVGLCLDHHARQLVKEDCVNFDYILVMDHLNYEAVLNISCNEKHHDKVFLLRTFDSESLDFHNVPDPYYGCNQDFTEVREIVTRSCRGFIEFLKSSNQI